MSPQHDCVLIMLTPSEQDVWIAGSIESEATVSGRVMSRSSCTARTAVDVLLMPMPLHVADAEKLNDVGPPLIT